MPQGALKQSNRAAKKNQRPKNTLKKGAKVIKARQTASKVEAKFAKKHSAALSSATEKLLSSRVGHLELLKGTRRELEAKKQK